MKNHPGILVPFLFLLLFSLQKVQAQSADFSRAADTVRLTLDSAEQRFMNRNMSMLAQKYNISATEALIIQARLYNNPNLQIGQALISGPNNDRQFFATNGPSGEETAQLQEVIILAGKRRKQINIAKINLEQAQFSYYELSRNLKSQLRSDFYSIYFQSRSLQVYDEEINSLKKIIVAFKSQLAGGFIAKKEVLRIQAQLFSLQNEYIALKQNITQAETDLNVLLANHNTYFIPLVDTDKLASLKAADISLKSLIDTAVTNRYDLRTAASSVMLGKQTYALQRSLATPDLTAGLNYDRAGAVQTNFLGFYLGIDLPFFNRNQGNIKNAKFQIQVYESQYQNQLHQVEADVMKAYSNALDNERLSTQLDPSFSKDFEHLSAEVLKNYEKRNLGLLEFLDYYDSYKQNVLQLNNLALNRLNGYEQINFSVGKDVIK